MSTIGAYLFSSISAVVTLSTVTLYLSFSSENLLASLLDDTHEVVTPTIVMKYVTQNGKDGLGHQLLGMYSCMLLPMLDDRFTYVIKNYTGHQHARSRYIVPLFALQR